MYCLLLGHMTWLVRFLAPWPISTILSRIGEMIRLFFYGYDRSYITWMKCLVHCKLRRGSRENHLRTFTKEPHKTPNFHLSLGGILETNETTSGICCILHLQDGSINLIGLQSGHKEISSLYAELKILTLTLKCYISSSALLHLFY